MIPIWINIVNIPLFLIWNAFFWLLSIVCGNNVGYAYCRLWIRVTCYWAATHKWDCHQTSKEIVFPRLHCSLERRERHFLNLLACLNNNPGLIAPPTTITNHQKSNFTLLAHQYHHAVKFNTQIFMIESFIPVHTGLILQWGETMV